MSEPLVEYNFHIPSAYQHPQDLPLHLGGHEGETHLDDGALIYLINTFGIKSMLDIGCGPGGMVGLAKSKGLEVLGVDGDDKVERSPEIQGLVTIHDFTTGPYLPTTTYDLGWCVEFVEHIEKKFMPNFVEAFKNCRYVMMTHALPGQPGHHHVNCMPAEYWVGVMEVSGFELLVDDTNRVREASTMRERYIRQQGYLFKNGRL